MKLSITKKTFNTPVLLICDSNCSKAWGINNRPKIMLSNDEDDYAFKADNELETAPDDPGTYEGGYGKPSNQEVHNKWCSRECERSIMVPLKDLTWGNCKSVELNTFEERVYNIKRRRK